MKNTLLLIALLFIAISSCKKKEETPTPTPPVVDTNLIGYSINGLKDIDIEDSVVSLNLEIKKEATAQENLTTSVIGLPAGITATFEPASGIPTYTTILKFSPDKSTPVGKYPIKVVLSSANGKKKTYEININVISATGKLIELSGDISVDTKLNSQNKYILKGFVYVTKNATLTIPAGTVIMGERVSKGTLIITRGSKIDAQGTQSQPVIFTSDQIPGNRQSGDWGGVVLLGKAPVNAGAGEAKMEGNLIPTALGAEKDYIWYGGSDANDNSGIMKYCRIEFAGLPFSPDNEINALTMAGVGSNTTISYIQVYRSGDDAFEWFGGTVNADHLVATYTWDDDFDTDLGYSGNVQFCVAHRQKNLADISGSNGFESDNNYDGSTATPQTKATFSNMTIVGPIITGNSTAGINTLFQNGVQIRRNSAQSIRNSIIIGFPTGVFIDGSKGTPTFKNLGSGTDGQLSFKNNIIAGCATAWKVTGLSGSSGDDAIWNAFKGQTSNTIINKAEDVLLQDPNKFASEIGTPVGRPSFLLSSSSPAISGSDFMSLPLIFQSVAYRGAFDGFNDWTLGWTTWSAEQTVY